MTTQKEENPAASGIWAIGVLLLIVGFIAGVGTMIYAFWSAANVNVICYWSGDSLICDDGGAEEKIEIVKNWVIISTVLVIVGFILKVIGNKRVKQQQ